MPHRSRWKSSLPAVKWRRQSAPRGEVVKFDSKQWRDGAYDIRVSTQDAWKQPQVRYLSWSREIRLQPCVA